MDRQGGEGPRSYSMRESMKSHRPCPACGGVLAHTSGCQILRKKTIGFSIILAVPVIAFMLFMAGPTGLVGIGIGAVIAAVIVRRRRGRDHAQRVGQSLKSSDAPAQ
jgi:Flp pilus assembly protein TadB